MREEPPGQPFCRLLPSAGRALVYQLTVQSEMLGRQPLPVEKQPSRLRTGATEVLPRLPFQSPAVSCPEIGALRALRLLSLGELHLHKGQLVCIFGKGTNRDGI